MKNEFRNSEGYYDPTAGKAIKNMMGGREVDIHRGDIFKREKKNQPGFDFLLVVSREERCKGGSTVICVRLDEEKDHLFDTQVNIAARGIKTACCDVMFYVYRGELGEYIRTATRIEMEAVDSCIVKALGLGTENEQCKNQDPLIEKSLLGTIDDYMIQVEKLETERDIYKQQVESLLDKIIGVKAG